MRETFTSRRAPLVLAVGTLLGLGIRLVQFAPQGTVLAYAGLVLVVGYVLSYARHVAVGTEVPLPGLAAVGTHVRHGIIGALVMALPTVVLVFGPTLIRKVAATIRDLLPFKVPPGSLAIVLTLLTVGAWLLVYTVPVIVGARYVYFDRLREGLRFIDAFKRAWALKWVTAVPLAAWLLLPIALLVVSYVVGLIVGSRFMNGFAEAALSAFAGQVSVASLKLAAGALVASFFWVGGLLVQGHLIGQLAAILYVDAAPAPVGWPNPRIQPTA